ncbi:probable DNA replication complex GINS protein PSF2 [Drosophila novamexicana]|uniref:probable DNA replication complex GINS protein PSF2 n=1 Tax=Drosophila novamexicana TaxID=47314 RepID=UPI0011E5D4CD|nr:probable DNA replication complex GINS protein PSF2 [Drosophila novamexicana]XP_030565610.1 probable DNA replication complex GINS protein PSF2 [Drosophila novamexicana]
MDPSIIEFIGEKSMISIIPNFSNEALHLIYGTVGPFRAGFPVYVPLWLATHLRKQQKCRIVPPEWMDLETLEEIKEEEKRSKFFTKMPSEHYMVVAQLVMSTAPDDVPRCEELRTIIKDIFDIRESKLRTSIDAFIKGEGTYAKLDNLTLLEIHSVRPILPYSLDHIARYQRIATASQRDTSMLGLSTTGGSGSGSATGTGSMSNSFFTQ